MGEGFKPFEKGYDPRRRVGGGASFSRRVMHNINALAENTKDGTARYDLAALEMIHNDARGDHARATAAGVLIYVRTTGWDKIAKTPRMLTTLNMLFDRQLGKPRQDISVEHRQGPPRTVAQVVADLRRLFQEHPHLLAAVMDEAADNAPPPLALVGSDQWEGATMSPAPSADKDNGAPDVEVPLDLDQRTT